MYLPCIHPDQIGLRSQIQPPPGLRPAPCLEPRLEDNVPRVYGVSDPEWDEPRSGSTLLLTSTTLGETYCFPTTSDTEQPTTCQMGPQPNALDEETIKREHPASRGHPTGCCKRPCHFAAGRCWKGLNCEFCHLCPKPKRKSKHQRDIDKKRSESYRKIREEHGEGCLQEMENIDGERRAAMTFSEEVVKAWAKQIFERGDATKIVAMRKILRKFYDDQSALRELTRAALSQCLPPAMSPDTDSDTSSQD